MGLREWRDKMKMKIFIICVVGLLLLLSGCVETPDTDQDRDGDIEAELSAVEFRVTDKVTEDFSHVNVTFTEIRLFKQMEDDESYITIPLGEKMGVCQRVQLFSVQRAD